MARRASRRFARSGRSERTVSDLVGFGGLPGVGKSSIAPLLLTYCNAVYLRIDSIGQALRDSGALAHDVGPASYLIAYAIAEANLRQHQVVVADSVNPLPVTRQAWRDVALAHRAAFWRSKWSAAIAMFIGSAWNRSTAIVRHCACRIGAACLRMTMCSGPSRIG